MGIAILTFRFSWPKIFVCAILLFLQSCVSNRPIRPSQVSLTTATACVWMVSSRIRNVGHMSLTLGFYLALSLFTSQCLKTTRNTLQLTNHPSKEPYFVHNLVTQSIHGLAWLRWTKMSGLFPSFFGKSRSDFQAYLRGVYKICDQLGPTILFKSFHLKNLQHSCRDVVRQHSQNAMPASQIKFRMLISDQVIEKWSLLFFLQIFFWW